MYSLWLDVGRDDGLGSQWVGLARGYRSRYASGSELL